MRISTMPDSQDVMTKTSDRMAARLFTGGGNPGISRAPRCRTANRRTIMHRVKIIRLQSRAMKPTDLLTMLAAGGAFWAPELPNCHFPGPAQQHSRGGRVLLTKG